MPNARKFIKFIPYGPVHAVKVSFNRIISCSQQKEFIPLTIHNLLFSKFQHRSEDSLVIQSHLGDEIISLSLNDLRLITGLLSKRLSYEGIKCADTVMQLQLKGHIRHQSVSELTRLAVKEGFFE